MLKYQMGTYHLNTINKIIREVSEQNPKPFFFFEKNFENVHFY